MMYLSALGYLPTYVSWRRRWAPGSGGTPWAEKRGGPYAVGERAGWADPASRTLSARVLGLVHSAGEGFAGSQRAEGRAGVERKNARRSQGTREAPGGERAAKRQPGGERAAKNGRRGMKLLVLGGTEF